MKRQPEGVEGLEQTRWHMTAEAQMTAYGFTPSEKRVAWILMQDMANKEISYELGITEQTVKEHLRMMYQKAHVRSRVGLVLALLQLVNGDDEQHATANRGRPSAA